MGSMTHVTSEPSSPWRSFTAPCRKDSNRHPRLWLHLPVSPRTPSSGPGSNLCFSSAQSHIHLIVGFKSHVSHWEEAVSGQLSQRGWYVWGGGRGGPVSQGRDSLASFTNRSPPQAQPLAPRSLLFFHRTWAPSHPLASVLGCPQVHTHWPPLPSVPSLKLLSPYMASSPNCHRDRMEA